MAKELVLDVIARKNSAALNSLADDFEKLSKETDDAGKSFKEAESFSKRLDDQIGKTKQQVHDLGVEFDKTGNKDVFANLKGAQKNLGDLTKIKTTLDKSLNLVENDTRSFWRKFGDTADNQIGKLGQKVQAAGASALESFGPVAAGIAAAIAVFASTAIVTGLGVGLIGAAALIDSKNAQLVSAFGQLKKDVGTELTDTAAPLVSSFKDALGKIDGFFASEKETIGKTFDSVKPAIGTLTDSLLRVLKPVLEQLPRLGQAFARTFADPKVQGSFESIGKSLASLLGTASQNGRSIAVVFQGIALAVNGAVLGINILSDAFNGLTAATKYVAPWLTALIDRATQVTDTNKFAAKSFDDVSQSEEETKQKTEALTQAMQDQINEQLSMTNASIGLKNDMADLGNQLNANRGTLDQNTAAGRQNASALLQIVSDAERVREANIAAGQGTDIANKKFGEQINQAIALGVKLGIPRDQLEGLLGVYKDYAGQPDVVHHVTTYFENRYDTGDPRTHHDSYSKRYGGIMSAAAKGAIYSASNPPLVKFAEPETGGEAYIPRRGISRAAAMGLLNTAAGWYGGSVVGSGSGGGGAVRTSVEFVGNTGDALASVIQTLLRQKKIVIKSQFVT